ncbi:PREDICTED: regulator of microtubule dynamics protein 1-like [Dufourea novaeangliae]|uniref:Regulator of microtubule dynamics protein 1 n=1 Tax=Dufourea novaeangliae TaxID=178035 RepID=A0A154P5Z2_DUFNO|nr:PREDICTED: regulator of microtubule dynamics protein 1-like [Dufourea novaeangliae]KZC07339.1 Regulator of microtubule dynamics protein 1 [Dufourea novaeangliae]
MNNLHNSSLIAAAIGVTVGVVSAAGIFLYHKILENQQHTTAVSNLNSANKRIAELQAELEALRLQQSQQKRKRKVSRRFTSNDSTYTATDNETDIDAFSIADTDIGDDEFYDCSDSESTVGENYIRTSEDLNQLDLILADIDKETNGDFNIQTYNKLQTLVKSHQDDVNVIWRFARACYEYAETIDNSDRRRMIIVEGIQHCEKLIDIQNADLYKWYAILIGLNGDYLSTADRIRNGVRFKKYVVMALEIQPDDNELHYLLGRFKFEIANLSWLEKKVAATLFAEFRASHDEALVCFETAVKLGNNTLQTQLYISKCHIALQQYSNAINCLVEILNQPVSITADEKVHAEAKTLLKNYSGYC